MALRITDAQLSVLAAAGCGVQEVPVAETLEPRDEYGEPAPDERLEEVRRPRARGSETSGGGQNQ